MLRLITNPETGRFLRMTYPQYEQGLGTLIEEGTIPQNANLADYCYINDEWIYDPLPVPEPEPEEPSEIDLRLQALEEQNEMLLECVLEMSEIMYA